MHKDTIAIFTLFRMYFFTLHGGNYRQGEAAKNSRTNRPAAWHSTKNNESQGIVYGSSHTDDLIDEMGHGRP